MGLASAGCVASDVRTHVMSFGRFGGVNGDISPACIYGAESTTRGFSPSFWNCKGWEPKQSQPIVVTYDRLDSGISSTP